MRRMRKKKTRLISHSKIIKDRAFQEWVCENKPCFNCSAVKNIINYSLIQFHHLQGKYRLGMALRNDAMGIPLCYPCHSIFQRRGERLYWEEVNIDPGIYAQELWEEWLERNK